jgi:hypothetical protein
MLYLIMFLATVALLALIGYAISSVVTYKTNSEVKASKEKDQVIKDQRAEIVSLKVQKVIAMDSLNKITADYTHNPSLEARVALDDIRAQEIAELNK